MPDRDFAREEAAIGRDYGVRPYLDMIGAFPAR